VVELSRDGFVMRGDDQTRSEFLHGTTKLVDHSLGQGSIEGSGRFVRQDHPRSAGDRTGGGHTLLLATGELRRENVRSLRPAVAPRLA
jgi:hypothetical protein